MPQLHLSAFPSLTNVFAAVWVVFSDMSIHYVEVEMEERKSIVDEAQDLRKRRQALSHSEPKPDLVLVQPIRCLS